VSLRMGFEELKIVHLSDLHFTGRPVSEFSSRFWRYFNLESISLANFEILLKDVIACDPHHIVITGDITNTAHPDEFRRARDWLLQLQQLWQPIRAPVGTEHLLSDLFTIVPGNHDVARRPGVFSRLFASRAAQTSRLRHFMEAFGSTLGVDSPDNIIDYAGVFPGRKLLYDVVQLFTVNSTLDVPVHAVGINSVGEVGETQRIRLAQALDDTRQGTYRIVLCHHHPLTIPYKPDAFDSLLVMRDARQLLRVCFRHQVHLVLHGHKHVPFIWRSVVIPELDPPHSLAVVSAGSATMAVRGSSQVYNRYIVVRRDFGGRQTVESVKVQARRFVPQEQCFVDAGPPVLLYQALPQGDLPHN